jgi:hypothetical protein
MVVDGAGELVTQRELPRMALIRPTLKGEELILRATGIAGSAPRPRPGRGALQGDGLERHRRGVRHGRALRPVVHRFPRPAAAPGALRSGAQAPADRRWTGTLEAETAFQDAFPFLGGLERRPSPR